MKQNERGLGMVFEIILVAIVLSVVGFAVFQYFQNKNAANTAAPSPTPVAAKAWQVGKPAVAGAFADADIVQLGGGTWRMFYATQPEVPGNNLEVYSATSHDGMTWTPELGTRKRQASFPSVVRLSDGSFRMYYQGAGAIKSALSQDGLAFSDEPGTRIDLLNAENLPFTNVAAPTVIQQDDGTFLMVYRGTINQRYANDTPNSTTQVLMWATSTDGITFTKQGLAVDSRNQQFAGELDGPELARWDDGKLRLFATSYTGVYEFELDGYKFGPGKLAFSVGKGSNSNLVTSVPPPGDPALIKIKDNWFMYYGSKDGINYAAFK